MSDTATMTKAILSADGRVLLEQPDGSYRLSEDQTDWQKVDQLTDEALAAEIAADPDDPANDPTFWRRAKLVYPCPKERITVRLDADMLDWFRAKGKGYQTRINAVLRAYFEAKQAR